LKLKYLAHFMRKAVLLLVLFGQIICAFGQSDCTCKSPVISSIEQTTDEVCKANAYLDKGKDDVNKKAFDNGIAQLTKALAIYKKESCYKQMTLTYYYLITASERMGDFTEAIKWNIEVHELALKEKDYNIACASYLNIAQIFNRLNQFEKSLQYSRGAIPLLDKEKDLYFKSGLENKLTARYIIYAQELHKLSYLDTAFFYASQALKNGESVKDTTTIIIANSKLGTINIEKKAFTLGLNHIKNGLQLCKENNISEKATLYLDYAKIELHNSNLNNAKAYADSSLKYCIIDKYPPMIANAYEVLYSIAIAQHQDKSALSSYIKFKEIRDSISTTQKSEAINALEQKFNKSEQEKQLYQLRNKNRFYLIVLLVLCLLSLGVYFYYKRKVYTQNQIILETEQRLNRARMNPHFFFNALTSLQSFAINETDAIVLAENLSKFSHIMRETLENSYREYVTVKQEEDFLREYLELQQLRFPQKFNFEINGIDDNDGDNYLIPSMIVQPFVENSIEHGFANLPYIGQLNISFIKTNDAIEVIVYDNGKGLNYALSQAKPYISRASQIIKDRIYLLNMKLKSNAKFSILNNDDNGVTVKIMLPIIEHV
jgi:Histidine kinase